MSTDTDSIAASERFLFEQEFDEFGQPRPLNRARTYAEDEFEAARMQAQAEGQQAGEDAAQQSLEADATRALQGIAAAMPAIADAFDGFAIGWRRDAAAIAATIGRKLAGRLMDQVPLEVIEDMIAGALRDLLEEPRLVIRTSATVADALSERLDGIAAGANFAGKLILLPDEAMSDQDCRIEWALGGVERDAAAVDAAITRAVEAFITPAPDERSAADV